LRELRGDQPADEIGIDGQFWVMHAVVSNCRAVLDDETQRGNSSPISR
jgi:hypothetical protein